MEYFFKTKNGFTLIELMVVIAIIGFFSSFLLINFRSNQKVAEVRQQALLVIDLIKRAQTMALSGQTVDGERPVGYGAVAICPNNDDPCLGVIAITDDGENWKMVTGTELSKNIILEGDIHLFAFSGSRANLEIIAIIDGHETIIQDTVLRIENVSDSTIAQCIGANALSGRIDLIDCPL
jgi:prepilin-type N-terminal cleavage/methylation domain-containing protein